MKKLIFTCLLGLVITSCSSTQKVVSYSSSHVSNERFRVGRVIKGRASWYGDQFQGKLTASGEKFNMNSYTAANKVLPFGTIVKVTNLSNNKSVNVKINDRGPYVKGRLIDLSRKAFKAISPSGVGVINVKVEIVDNSKTFRYKHSK